MEEIISTFNFFFFNSIVLLYPRFYFHSLRYYFKTLLLCFSLFFVGAHGCRVRVGQLFCGMRVPENEMDFLPPWPNTTICYPLFEVHLLPMPVIPLRPVAWQVLAGSYLDPHVIDAVVGMAMFGAKIGYDGKHLGQRVARNSASAAL